jgi:hypothetical protein
MRGLFIIDLSSGYVRLTTSIRFTRLVLVIRLVLRVVRGIVAKRGPDAAVEQSARKCVFQRVFQTPPYVVNSKRTQTLEAIASGAVLLIYSGSHLIFQ